MKEEYAKLSIDKRDKLLAILNDIPTIVNICNKEHRVNALKPYTLRRIAEIASKIKHTNEEVDNILVNMATSVPCLCEIIALLILNEKSRNHDEFQKMVRYIEDNAENLYLDAVNIITVTLELLDVGFFFRVTETTEIFYQMMTNKKGTTE